MVTTKNKKVILITGASSGLGKTITKNLSLENFQIVVCARNLALLKKVYKKNKNVYRGYFPNDVNGKEGLDIGDLLITKQYSNKVKK